MERFFSIIKLGIKYLYRYRRRYYFLLAALIFGFTIVTFITSTKDGMYENVYYSAQSHYAGDIIAISHEAYFDGDFIHRMGQDEISAILDAVDASGINPQHTVMRTLSGTSAFIHYNGIAVQLRYLTGCDWEKESHLFDRMNFAEPLDPFIDDDGIILSVPVALRLGAQMGDSVIVELETRFRQKNTGLFIVKGIIQDTSIFGYYKAYISRPAHNRLLMNNDDDCSAIGFFLEDPAAAEKKRVLLQQFLSGKVQLGPLVYDREGMVLERDRPWEGIRIFLYTMPVYLSEIANLLNAMNIITYLLYVMMLLIVLASAAVTYRLILHERSREMGIMRAIGFYGRDLRLVLWTEIIVLGIISMFMGFICARLLNWAVSFLSFSWFPGFEIFLKGGRLAAQYLPGTILVNVALLLFVLITMVLFPTFRVSRKNLPGLLSGDPL